MLVPALEVPVEPVEHLIGQSHRVGVGLQSFTAWQTLDLMFGWIVVSPLTGQRLDFDARIFAIWWVGKDMWGSTFNLACPEM